jgi:hypothetical protein
MRHTFAAHFRNNLPKNPAKSGVWIPLINAMNDPLIR